MTPKKRKVSKHGNDRWELDYGLDAMGKKRRRFFETEALADAEIAKCQKTEKSHGEFWIRMSPMERSSTVSVLQEVKAAGLTVSHVWERYQAAKKEVDSQATTTPMPYEDVVKEFVRRKTEALKTERYVENTRDFLMRFGAGRERQNIHEIPVDDLETWISGQTKDLGWSASTKRTYMLLFSSLWSVAIKKGWAITNIVKKLEPVTVPGPKIEIFSNDDTMHIMAAAMSTPTTQQILAPLALGFFGCMRPEEVASVKALRAGLSGDLLFGWHDIDLKNGLVKVRSEIAKTGDERTIRLQPAAIAWLKLAKKLKNPLPAVNERRLVDQCCELIALSNWIRDGLRKNCATHLRAVYRDDYDVIKDLGNSVRVLLKHYAALHIPDEVSLAHWKITPTAVEKFVKTKAWEKVLRDAAKVTASPTDPSPKPPKPSANGTAKSGN